MREFNYGPPMAEYGRNHEERLRKKRQFKFKIFGGVGGSTPFNPSKIVGLVAWFRFNQGITSAANLVSQWDDASGNGHPLKQTAGGSQPLMQPDGSMIFDGATDFLETDSLILAQPQTVYLLVSQLTWTLNDILLDGSGAIRIQQTTSSPKISISAGSLVAENTNLAVNTFGVITAIFNGASSLLQINNTTATTGNAGTNAVAKITLGGGSGHTVFGNIQVKELVMFNTAHDAATRQQMINYMASVGGLSI